MSGQTVFVSYVADDAADARSLMSDLTRAGVAVADRASLVKPGLRTRAAVRDAINTTSCFLLCLSSRDGLPAAYAEDELQTAIAAKRSIIPVRLTRCDIPEVRIDDEGTIADLEPVDFYADREAGVEVLMTVLPVSTPRIESRDQTTVRIGGKIKSRNGVKMDGEKLSVTVDGDIETEGTTEIGS